MSGGDKILSENYFQHAYHFTRVLTEQDIQKKAKFSKESAVNLTQTENNLNKSQDLLEEENKEVSN